MFNNNKIKIISIICLLIGIIGFYFISLNLNLSAEKLLTIPKSQDLLALQYKNACVALVRVETVTDKLLQLKMSVSDIKNVDRRVLILDSYFNTIGQLIAANIEHLEDRFEISGISDVLIKRLDKKTIIKGPITSKWDDDNVTLEYDYGIRSGLINKYRVFLRDLSLINQDQCKSISDLSKLLEELKNA